jgi:UDP-N-acetyl-D-mannosaminuronate dehydrogenase
VNIALVNGLAMFRERMRIDVCELVEAAAMTGSGTCASRLR